MTETVEVRARKMADALQRDHSDMPFRDDAVATLSRQAAAKLDELESRLSRPASVSEEVTEDLYAAFQEILRGCQPEWMMTAKWGEIIDALVERALASASTGGEISAHNAVIDEAIIAVKLSAWMHAGDDAYSQGMDAGARHQIAQSIAALRTLKKDSE